MNRYFILRENVQHGPYSFEELSLNGLRSFDLVWVEGRSSAWDDPADVPELQALVRKEPGLSAENLENTPSGYINASLPRSASPIPTFEEPELPPKQEGARHELNESYRASLLRKQERNTSGLSRPRVVLLSFLAGALLLGALSLHSFLDTDYAAKSRIGVKGRNAAGLSQEPNEYQTALRFEAVPKPDTLVEMKKAKVIRPKSLRKMVLVKGSRYDVDLPGGIKDLQLTVSNKSPHAIDKATIAVDYLRPNGSLIRSERFTVQHLKGYGSRTVDVPSSKRGVNVRYRVTEVQSGRYSDELRRM